MSLLEYFNTLVGVFPTVLANLYLVIAKPPPLLSILLISRSYIFPLLSWNCSSDPFTRLPSFCFLYQWLQALCFRFFPPSLFMVRTDVFFLDPRSSKTFRVFLCCICCHLTHSFFFSSFFSPLAPVSRPTFISRWDEIRE